MPINLKRVIGPTFKTLPNVPKSEYSRKFTLRSGFLMLEKKTKTKKTKTRAVSQNPQASASMLNVVDHDSAI